LLCIISLNGGWTADPESNKPGRDLGYTRYDIMAQGLGCYGEYVEQPEDIRPALERAQKKVDDAWSRSSMSPDGNAAPRGSDAQNITVVPVKEGVIQSRFLRNVLSGGVFNLRVCRLCPLSQLAAYAGVTGF
jgi:hypothetical protein